MIRKAATKRRVVGNKAVLDVFMEGVVAPCLFIDIQHEGKEVCLIESWHDVERCNHKGKICRNGVNCAVNEQMKSAPLTTGEVIEIHDDERIYIVHPVSILEKKKR